MDSADATRQSPDVVAEGRSASPMASGRPKLKPKPKVEQKPRQSPPVGEAYEIPLSIQVPQVQQATSAQDYRLDNLVPGTYNFDGRLFTPCEPVNPYQAGSDYIRVTSGVNKDSETSQSETIPSSDNDDGDDDGEGVTVASATDRLQNLHVHVHINLADLLRQQRRPVVRRKRRGTLKANRDTTTGRHHGNDNVSFPVRTSSRPRDQPMPPQIPARKEDEQPPTVPPRTYRKPDEQGTAKRSKKSAGGPEQQGDTSDSDEDSSSVSGAEEEGDGGGGEHDYEPITPGNQHMHASPGEAKATLTGSVSMPSLTGAKLSRRKSYDELDFSGYGRFDNDERIKKEMEYFLENQVEWYRPNREDAERFVEGCKEDGHFAVVGEDLEKMPESPFTLIVRNKGNVEHYHITRSFKSKRFHLLQGVRKETLRELISHYQRHKLPVLKIKLKTYGKHENFGKAKSTAPS